MTFVLPNGTFHGSGFWLLSEGGDPMTRPSTPRFLAVFLAGTVVAAQAPPGGPGDLGPGCVRPGLGFPPTMAEPGAPGPAGRGPWWGPQGPPIPRFLNLTAAQEKSVKAILERHMAVQVGRHWALGAKEAALREGLEDPGLSDAQLRALLAAESEAKLQAVLEERAVFLETYAVLSPEQQAMALRLRQKLQKEREAHREVVEELCGPEGPGPRALTGKSPGR